MEALSPSEKRRYDNLRAAVAAGSVAERSAPAQAFHRAMTGGEKAYYSRLTPAGKSRWRMNWAQATLSRMVRSRLDAMTQLSEAVGTFLSLGSIVQEEGGYDVPENIKAALRYVRRAMQLHSQPTADRLWARYNEETQRAEFLYVPFTQTCLRSSFGIELRDDVGTVRVGSSVSCRHKCPRTPPP